MIVELPIKTVSTTNAREHWKAKWVREQREHKAAFNGMLAANRFRPQPPMRIRLVRLGARKIDPGNLQALFKATQDGVSEYLGIDDGDPRLEWEYDQELDPKRNGKRAVRVEIVETAE